MVGSDWATKEGSILELNRARTRPKLRLYWILFEHGLTPSLDWKTSRLPNSFQSGRQSNLKLAQSGGPSASEGPFSALLIDDLIASLLVLDCISSYLWRHPEAESTTLTCAYIQRRRPPCCSSGLVRIWLAVSRLDPACNCLSLLDCVNLNPV